MNRFPIGTLLCIVVAGCAPLRMGESQATLVGLLEKQGECDRKVGAGLKIDDKHRVECFEVSDALAKMSRELAAEAGKTGASLQNAVFFYRRAATAGWRSEQPKAMNDAITYASAGAKICETATSTSEVPPGDCALMYVTAGLVTHDEGALAFRSFTRGTPAGKEERKRRLVGEGGGNTTSPEKTPFGRANHAAYSGWLLLREGARKSCSSEVHESVREYLMKVHGDMVANLQLMHAEALLIANRIYDDTVEEYAAACKVTGNGRESIQLKGEPPDIGERFNGEAWCRWQFAKRNAPACSRAANP